MQLNELMVCLRLGNLAKSTEIKMANPVMKPKCFCLGSQRERHPFLVLSTPSYKLTYT